MKVTREEINKLKQLDRIEFYSKINFIQIQQKIQEAIILLTLFLILIAKWTISILNEYSMMIWIIWIIPAIIFWMIILSINNKSFNKKYESIEKEFFEVKGK